MAFAVYKSPLYEQSSRVIEKRKKNFRYHVSLHRYFTGTEKSAFQAKLVKNWAVFCL